MRISTIRFRLARRGRLIDVDVRDARECPRLACFFPARHTIRSAAGMSGCSSRTTDEWECGTREQRGCPPAEMRRAADPPAYRKVGGAWEAT